jgi:RNA polymerase sigma-70 factor (ECF subfamily)
MSLQIFRPARKSTPFTISRKIARHTCFTSRRAMASQSQPIVLTPNDGGETGRLFREWGKPLTRFLVCSGLTADGASDIVQDVFLRLHQHLMAGGARDNLRGWVFRVAHNLAVNRQKRKGHSPLEGTEDVPCPDGDPERLFFKKDRFRRLHAAMKELTPVERECVVLRSEGLRYREIAGVLEIGTSTVADHLDRALRKLGEKCNV